MRMDVLFSCLVLVFCLCACATTQSREISHKERLAQNRALQSKQRPYSCHFRYNRWRPYGVRLRAKSSTPDFGMLRYTKNGIHSKLYFSSQGPKKGVFLRLEAQGVILRAWSVGPRAVPFYSNRPVRFGSTLVSTKWGRLLWQGYQDRSMLVSLDTGATYHPIKKPVARVACEHTTLVPRKLGDVQFFLGLPPTAKKQFLQIGQRIPLSATPGGKIEGHLFFKYSYPSMEWLEEKGDFSRIFLKYGGYAVTGWVPKNFVVPKKPKGAVGFGGLLGSLQRRAKSPQSPFQCKQALPLYARKGGVSWKVGMIRPKTSFFSLSTMGAWTNIRFHRIPWLSLLKGASWQVPAHVLQSCQAIPVPSYQKGNLFK